MPQGGSLGDATLTLRVDAGRLKQDLDRAEKDSTKRLRAMSTRLRGVGLGAAAVGAPIAAIGTIALKAATEFDKGFREVQTLLTDITDKQLADLEQGVRDVSRELGLATSDTVPALYQAISAGVPSNNVIDFLRIAGKAAIGGVTDIKTAVDGITSVVNAYGADALNASQASDIMFTAVRLGKTTFDELAASLFNTVPIAAATGVRFQEVAAALAALTAQGVPTNVATTQLRAAIQALSAPTVRQVKLIEQLGLDFSAARLQQTGLSAAFKEAIDAADGDMAMLRRLIGSVEGLQAVLALGGEQSYKFDDALAQMEASAGATETAFRIMDASMSQRIAKTMEQFRYILLSVGMALLPILAAVVDLVTPILSVVSQWIDRNDKLAGVIFMVVGGLGAFLVVGGLSLVLVSLLISAWATLAGTGLTVTGVATAMWAAILGPVGLIVVALAGVGVALGVLYFKVDAVRRAINSVVGAVWDFARAAISALTPVANLLGKVAGFLGVGNAGVDVSAGGGGGGGVGVGQTNEIAPTTNPELNATVREMSESVGEAVQKSTSSLVTGRTRWRNIKFEQAQASAAELIVDAIEGQTKKLVEAWKQPDFKPPIPPPGFMIPPPAPPPPPAEPEKWTLEWWKNVLDLGSIANWWKEWFSKVFDFSKLDFSFFQGIADFFKGINWGAAASFFQGLGGKLKDGLGRLWSDLKDDLGSLIPELDWFKFVNPLYWLDWLVNLDWWEFITQALDWLTFIPQKLFWALFIPLKLIWAQFIPMMLVWARFIPQKLLWALFIPMKLIWTQFIPMMLAWKRFIPTNLVWKEFVELLTSWKEFITGVDLGDFVRGVDLGSFVSGIQSNFDFSIGNFKDDLIGAVEETIGWNVPFHGEGGIAMRPHLAVVGDEPEAIIPLSEMGHMMGGGTTNVIFQGPVYGLDDVESKARKGVKEGKRRGTG